MDIKSNMQKGKYGNNVLLLIVLIGFCILAIIEIFCGQVQSRMERERLAIEEENHQAVQELKTELGNLRGNPDANTEFVEALGEEQKGSEETAVDDKEYAMQIVVLGDNIMAAGREENKDVPTLIGEACNARVYNLAVGGTSAALLPGEQYNFADWDSTGLLGVVNAILGNIGPYVFAGYETENILEQCDFSKTDYFVIEYGINDFLSRQIPQSRYLENGEILGVDESHTYAGAMDIAVRLLTEHFPDAKILIVSPHFCQIYESASYMGDAYGMNYGYGTLVDFFRVAGYVASQHKAEDVFFFNAMEESGIDVYTADKFLEDGINLSDEGRRMYADQIAEQIHADFNRPE